VRRERMKYARKGPQTKPIVAVPAAIESGHGDSASD